MHRTKLSHLVSALTLVCLSCVAKPSINEDSTEIYLNPDVTLTKVTDGDYEDVDGHVWTLLGAANFTKREQGGEEDRTLVEEVLVDRAAPSLEQLASDISAVKVQDGKVYKLRELPLELARAVMSQSQAPHRQGSQGYGGKLSPIPTDSSPTPSTIFTPNDTNRYPVSPSSSYPARASGHLDGDGCTAFFVGPRSIVTSAHCFYTRSTKSWHADGPFIPGRQTYSLFGSEPWGRWPIASFYVPNAYIDETKTMDEATPCVSVVAGWFEQQSSGARS